jgi:hypothetical protein
VHERLQRRSKRVSRNHKERQEVFVVLRADLFHAPGTALEALVTAKQVVHSRELAEREVSRLNALHPDGEVRYWYTSSRLFPPGLSAGSSEAPAEYAVELDTRAGRLHMTDSIAERHRAAEDARDVLAGRMPWSTFSATYAECDDPLIEELFDLLEHEPQRGGFLGASEEEWQQHRRAAEQAIAALERSES